MDFFSSLPQPEPPPRRERPKPPPWAHPRDGAVPATVPIDRILHRTSELAVVLGGVRAHAEGFEFTLLIVRPPNQEWESRRHRPARPFGHRGVFRGEDDAPASVMRVGVLFEDGRRTTSTNGPVSRMFGEDATPPEPPVMQHLHGSGSDSSWEQTFWVWGLPEQGPVTLVYDWEAEGIPESRFDLDGDVLRAAATRAVVLWPEAPSA